MLYIACDDKSIELFDFISNYLKLENIEYFLVARGGDTLDISQKVVDLILESPQVNRGIIIDENTIGPFLLGAKHSKIICAPTHEEHTSLMTRDHNNANLIVLGSKIVGQGVAMNIVNRFVKHHYAGGRHQIRIDMLNSMGRTI